MKDARHSRTQLRVVTIRNLKAEGIFFAYINRLLIYGDHCLSQYMEIIA